MGADTDEQLEQRVEQLEQQLSKMLPGRRGVLKGLGAAAIGGAAVGGATGGAAGQSAAGQIGTESEPVDVEAASVGAQSVSTGETETDELRGGFVTDSEPTDSQDGDVWLDTAFPETGARMYLPDVNITVSSGVFEKVQLDKVRYNHRGEFDANNSRFVADEDGMYSIEAQVRWDLTETDVATFAQIVVDSTPLNETNLAYVTVRNGDTNASDATANISDTLQLAAGDTVELHVRQDSGVDQDLRPGGDSTYLTVNQIA
jgi:hypothetical protein